MSLLPWQGEAPERPYDKAGEPDDFWPNDVDRPKRAPSRGLALGSRLGAILGVTLPSTEHRQSLQQDCQVVREPRPTKLLAGAGAHPYQVQTCKN